MKALKNRNCNKKHVMWDLTKMGTYVSLHSDFYFFLSISWWSLRTETSHLSSSTQIYRCVRWWSDYVLTANSSRADKSYACMHINTHIHSAVISEAKTFFLLWKERGLKNTTANFPSLTSSSCSFIKHEHMSPSVCTC